MTRRCVYTNKEAKAKDSVLPKRILGDESHNWSTHVPVDDQYKSQKAERLPTELELQAHELFHLLELARLRVKYYEAKLADVQAEILKDYKEPIKTGPTKSEKAKEKQIQTAIIQKEVLEEKKVELDQFFEKKRALWGDEE